MRWGDRRILMVLTAVLLVLCWAVPSHSQFWRSKEPKATQELREVSTPQTITLNVVADPQLNLYDSLSHVTHVCVYQLIDSNVFQQLSGDEKGLIQLMDCERVDPSVAASRRLVLQPGEKQTVELDRAEGVRYVGISAGYYPLQKRNGIRLYRLPVTEGSGRDAKARPFRIDLRLGPRSLSDTGEKP